MPNWVQNIIIPNNCNTYKKYAVTKNIDTQGNLKTKVDFNIVVPEPEELGLTNGFQVMDNYISREMTEYYKKIALKCSFKDFLNGIITDPQIKKKYSKPIVIPKKLPIYQDINDPDLRSLIEYIANVWCYMHYGHSNWYEWRVNNWGCKWNASEASDDGKYFQTPYDPPYFWIKELSHHTEILCLYANEDFGSNCGVIVASKGHANRFELIDADINSYAFACKLWDYDEPEWDGKAIDPQDTDELVKGFLYEINLTEKLQIKVLNALGI